MSSFVPQIALILTGTFLFSCSDDPQTDPSAENTDHLSGGETTVFDATSHAFSLPAPNLSAASLSRHIDGDAAFGQHFVTAPAEVFGGLGPLYNNTSCQNCHVRDGRGKAPAPGEQLTSLLLRASVAGSSDHGGPVGAPGFGGQIQPKATTGIQPETEIQVSYELISGSYPDGTGWQLRKPVFTLVNSYTGIPAGMMLSPRLSPPVFGLGLLEAVPSSEIIGLSDPDDLNQDGISGRPNYVWDVISQSVQLGRFGWKANTPNLLQQTANAFQEDMGITSPFFPKENSYGQPQDSKLDDDPEITGDYADLTAFYVRTLAVPAQRNPGDPQVVKGKDLFNSAGCKSCHTPQLKTGLHPVVSELSNQTIHPYTDLLLHDMGEDLADGRPDYLATGSEWRTPPLWGIGLTEVVTGTPYYLHDGRARSLEEAILWHGGEAEKSKENFKKLSKVERDQLVTFLKSL